MPKRIEHYARQMRKRPTPSEKRFRLILDKCCKVIGCKYESQKTFWNSSLGKAYIVDFYIPDYQVVIEIDGPYHQNDEQAKADALRDSWFINNRKRVVRVLNNQTLNEGYCMDLLYNSLKVKRREPIPKRIKRAKVIKDDQGITQCPPYTEGNYKRDQFIAWYRSPKKPKDRVLTMRVAKHDR